MFKNGKGELGDVIGSMEKGLLLTLDIFQQTFRLILKPSSVI